MFSALGRRLALLNALVVVGVVALIVVSSYAVIHRILSSELDRELNDRADSAAATWAVTLGSGRREPPRLAPVINAVLEDGIGGSVDDLLEGGDTLVYVVAPDGEMVVGPTRGAFDGLPDRSGVAAALAGRSDLRDAMVGDNPVRLLSRPLVANGRIAGAVQVVRGTAQQANQLRLVAVASVAAVGFGALVAVPAALFLAGRAMRPIDAAFARQRAFVADASHELRTPLALIRANLELAQRLAPPPDVGAELDGVVGEVDQMARLIDDLLFLARIDAGRAPSRRERFDLAAAVDSAVAPMRSLAERSGLRLGVDGASSVPIDADPDQIRRLVRILVDNAIRYTPAGGRVDVAVGREEGRGVVRVRDTGVGIAPADQARIFERFFRSDAARSRQTGGSGLGLGIARAIVDAHAGRIGVTSQPGAGTEIRVSLPLATAPAPVEAGERAEGPRSHRTPGPPVAPAPRRHSERSGESVGL